MKLLFTLLRAKFKELKITNYYLNKSQNKQRSLASRTFDHAALALLTALTAFFIFYRFNQRFTIAAAGAFSASILFIAGLYFSQRSKAGKIRAKNRETICEVIFGQWLTSREQHQFAQDIKDVLGEVDGIEDIVVIEDNLLQCAHKDQKTLIFIKKAPPEQLINREEIIDFENTLSIKGCQKGIFITCSDFTNAALLECQKADIPITAFGKRKLHSLLRNTNCFPTENQIDEVEETEVFGNSRRTKQDIIDMVFNSAKTKNYLMLAVFLFVFSGFIDKNEYYIIGGVILSLLGICSYTINYWGKYKEQSHSHNIDLFE